MHVPGVHAAFCALVHRSAPVLLQSENEAIQVLAAPQDLIGLRGVLCDLCLKKPLNFLAHRQHLHI